MNDEILTAKDLEVFLNKLRASEQQFYGSFSEVGEYDKKDCDLRHSIEFEKNYDRRNRLCTKYHKLLNDRRVAKDMVEFTQQVADFMESNKQFIKKLEQLLGDMRKKEEVMQNRFYKKRSRKDV